MDLMEALRTRHSVRAYTDEPLSEQDVTTLRSKIDTCNAQSGLHMQLILNEPRAFSGLMARYGHFSGVKNYIALIGPTSANFDEKCGYYGEALVLAAQMLGLNTCWVGASYRKTKSAYDIRPGERLCAVISVGRGQTPGTAHKSKTLRDVAEFDGTAPDWFVRGMEAALLAPTALNQQKFRFILEDGTVTAKSGRGPFAKVDLGIAEYHFNIGSGRDIFLPR